MDQTVDDLQKSIAEYSTQLTEIELILSSDPENAELVEAKTTLLDVIKELSDILELKKKIENKEKGKVEPKVDDKTKLMQEAAASKGVYVGMLCEAIYSIDDQWYNARVSDINGKGCVVVFDGYNNSEVVTPDSIRPRQEKSTQLTGKKRKEPETSSSIALSHIPKSLQILPTDSEKVRLSKKKRIKSLKSKTRLQKIEETRNQSKSSWQDFLNKGNKVLPKDSIFKSPEGLDGKVGVVGSGKGMTPTPQFTQLKKRKTEIHLPE